MAGLLGSAPRPVPDTYNWYARLDGTLGSAGSPSISERGTLYGTNLDPSNNLVGPPFGNSSGWIGTGTDLSRGFGLGIGYYFAPRFRGDLTLFVYPYLDPQTDRVMTTETIDLPMTEKPLYQYSLRSGRLVGLDNHRVECLPIKSREVLKQIAAGNPEWESLVPEGVAKIIKERKMFGYRER